MILLFGVVFLALTSGAEGSGSCVETHTFNEETDLCDWTGPKDACIQLLDYWNRSWFMPMPDFPRNIYQEVDLAAIRSFMDDYAVKVVVRRGCMFTGYQFQASPDKGDGRREVKVAENLVYGAHTLANYMTTRSALKLGAYFEGLTRPTCVCDPTEATVNGHVPAPPADRKCIEHHVFNETTQQCEWKLDSKYCAQIITNDNRKQFLEIPNWPAKRKYDVNHFATKNNQNFHLTVTSIIVRQHCFATLLWDRNDFHPWKTMPTMGYGQYTVASRENGLATPGIGGTARFICECIH